MQVRIKLEFLLGIIATLITIFLLGLPVYPGDSRSFDSVSDWKSYAADKASTKYLPVDQIHSGNVKDLRILWRWESIDQPILRSNQNLWTMPFEATPLLVRGVLYVSTSLSQVAAIDAKSGNTLWHFDPESYRHGPGPNVGFVHRGVAYWERNAEKRIVFGSNDAFLIALDPATGRLIKSFGTNGRIDLTRGLRRAVDRKFYGVTSPPMICRDTVIVGSSIYDFSIINDEYPLKEPPPGDIRGFDVRTGRQLWSFHSIPQQGEEGVDTWEDDSWKYSGNTNVWTTMSCDEDRGIVYLPFGTPSHDLYGGKRLGDNLYAETLVALDAKNGRKIWHFQMVHHGLWDYDLPTAPNLVDLVVRGKPVKALAQVTKQGFCYVLDRVSGVPVFPIEERAVPQSTIPGERTSPTQPFPSKPAPFERQGLLLDEVIDFTPELRRQAIKLLENFEYGPLFTPLKENRPTVLLPGTTGGASWAGAAVNPETGTLYVTSVMSPHTVKLVPSRSPSSFYPYSAGTLSALDGPQGLPILKPPYGRVTAIDLNAGDHLWSSPVGEGPRNHEALRHLRLPKLGWPRRSFPLLTKSLLLVAQEGKGRLRGSSPLKNAVEYETEVHDPYLFAFDTRTGEELAAVKLPGNATGGLITGFVAGKQIVVIPIGGASQPAALIALSLP